MSEATETPVITLVSLVEFVVFLVLVTGTSERIEFALPSNLLSRNRARRKLVAKWLKENPLNNANVAKQLVRSAKESPFGSAGTSISVRYVYMPLPGVNECIATYFTGPSLSGCRDGTTGYSPDEYVGDTSKAGWSELLAILSLLYALFSSDVIASRLDTRTCTNFFKDIRAGLMYRRNGYGQTLRYIILSTRTQPLDYQRKFLEIMKDVPPYNSKASDPGMLKLVEAFCRSDDYKTGQKLMDVKRAETAADV